MIIIKFPLKQCDWSVYTCYLLSLGQTSNFWWDEPNLLRVWHLAQLSSSEWVWIIQHILSIWTEDRLQNKHQSSHVMNYTNKLKVCLFLLLTWFSWLVQCALSSTSDPTKFGLGLSFHSSHLDYFHLCRRSLLLLQI